MPNIKRAVVAVLPPSIVKTMRIYKAKVGVYRAIYKAHINGKKQIQPLHEVFANVYETGSWGASSDPSQTYYSGDGSHDNRVASAYIKAVHEFLSSFPDKPNVVDIGCGDFSIGSRIRPLCNRYIACDVVPKLIDFDREKFKERDVDFRVLDVTSGELPAGDVLFIREVFQHLSNQQILRALSGISSKHYKYFVFTDLIPTEQKFKPNLNKPAGAGTRIPQRSGVVLSEPPFNFKFETQTTLCEVQQTEGGRIQSIIYKLS